LFNPSLHDQRHKKDIKQQHLPAYTSARGVLDDSRI